MAGLVAPPKPASAPAPEIPAEPDRAPPRFGGWIAVVYAAALVAAVHWLLLYAVTVFPAEHPAEILAWAVAGVVALLLWLMRGGELHREAEPTF